jgi:hypothetical protein
MMRMIGLALMASVVCAIGPPRETSFGDVTMPFRPGSVNEQHNEIPPETTPLASIFKQLEAEEDAVKEGALLWLLQRERATDLAYFQRESIRFGVDRVRKAEIRGILWRLVECRYLSRTAEIIGGIERRAVWSVAYLFDDLGNLRDWVDDYDVLFLDDLNADGRVELFAYTDSPKRAIMYSYDRGRARELLRVDGVPEGVEAIRVIAGEKGKPFRVAVATGGTFEWDARLERYVKVAPSVTASANRKRLMKRVPEDLIGRFY